VRPLFCLVALGALAVLGLRRPRDFLSIYKTAKNFFNGTAPVAFLKAMNHDSAAEDLVNLIEIKRLYDYNSWANERVLESLQLIGQEDFTSNKQASHGSIRGIIAHIAAAEWIWLERWEGSSPVGLLPESEFETLEIATQRLRKIDHDLQRFTNRLTQANLDGRRGYKTTEGKAYSNVLSDMLLHLVNHSSYHRGQIATLLRQSGAVPQSTDFILFIRLKEE
jgi:uncharacterized damage-inducible protein DinB